MPPKYTRKQWFAIRDRLKREGKWDESRANKRKYEGDHVGEVPTKEVPKPSESNFITCNVSSAETSNILLQNYSVTREHNYEKVSKENSINTRANMESQPLSSVVNTPSH
ncbi:hypothetical protein CDAR_587091 [Caerostris darwini]|uniref:Uncharacterized protein n=1 Tax=Caerostris darwini TaxID=1538125 RepID=A0AAV4T052_9ARAC|nr:hypothetical protein CDAR_587091 [Caerostris darwini]